MYIMNICTKFTVDASGFMSILMYIRTYLSSYTPYLCTCIQELVYDIKYSLKSN